MAEFTLFLQGVAFLLSAMSLVLVYMAVNSCKESVFVPIYYFIAFSITGVLMLSLSKMGATLFGSSFWLSSAIMQDLFLAYIALFLFGSLWQSYEASICVPPTFNDDN